MGLGDWIMATAQVKALHAKTGKQVAIVGRGNRSMWSEVFENNPKIVTRPQRNVLTLVNGPGLRPYIAAKERLRWVWRPWAIEPGELFFTPEERAYAEPFRGCVMIEPHTKVPDGNKAWHWERWQTVVDASDERFVQVGPHGTRFLAGVEQVITDSFRQAAAILSVARAFAGCEGALHHAAAALSVPAVVLWSEFISPDITGYFGQTNIRHAGVACGSRIPCAGCRASMDKITVVEVMQALEEVSDVVKA